jgi:hypothetical protein
MLPVHAAGCIHLGDVRDIFKALVTWNPLEDTRFNNPDHGLSACVDGGARDANGKRSVYHNTLSELLPKHWDLLADVYGLPCHGTATLQWLYRLVEENNLVDTFVEARPYIKNSRFTCWEQYTNRRYANEGSRIDMILLDAHWWDDCGVVGRELSGFDKMPIPPCMGDPFKVKVTELTSQRKSRSSYSIRNMQVNEYPHKYPDPVQAQAALLACTANNLFIPAPFAGGGIPSAIPAAYEHQFGSPHTGIIYTPPEFSDHVAIAVCLRRSSGDEQQEQKTHLLGSLQVATDVETRFTQPYRKQQSITSMFQKQRQLTVPPGAAACLVSSTSEVNVTTASSGSTENTASVVSIATAVVAHEPFASAEIVPVPLLSAPIATALPVTTTTAPSKIDSKPVTGTKQATASKAAKSFASFFAPTQITTSPRTPTASEMPKDVPSDSSALSAAAVAPSMSNSGIDVIVIDDTTCRPEPKRPPSGTLFDHFTKAKKPKC